MKNHPLNAVTKRLERRASACSLAIQGARRLFELHHSDPGHTAEIGDIRGQQRKSVRDRRCALISAFQRLASAGSSCRRPAKSRLSSASARPSGSAGGTSRATTFLPRSMENDTSRNCTWFRTSEKPRAALVAEIVLSRMANIPIRLSDFKSTTRTPTCGWPSNREAT